MKKYDLLAASALCMLAAIPAARPWVAARARPFGLPVSNQNQPRSQEPAEKSLEDGEDLGSGTLGPGERMDDRPITVLIPTNTDDDVDDLSGHIGR